MHTNRHNQITVTVSICGEYGLPIPNSQQNTQQREVLEQQSWDPAGLQPSGCQAAAG